MRRRHHRRHRRHAAYDVEQDTQALARLRQLAKAPYVVPLLVEDGEIIQVGWQGRGCVVGK